VRKKSHISLARYIVEAVEIAELDNHRKAFIIGNILPDCKPSFITTKHEFDTTYDQVKESIRELTEDCNIFNRKERVYWRNIGEIIHYLADYFTFPHNKNYDGTLKDHCSYEQELKLSLREFIKSGEAAKCHKAIKSFDSLDALFEFIEQRHQEYLRFKSTIEKDCQYIVSLCYQVVYAMIELLNHKLAMALYPALA